jgi:hypothetical protein
MGVDNNLSSRARSEGSPGYFLLREQMRVVAMCAAAVLGLSPSGEDVIRVLDDDRLNGYRSSRSFASGSGLQYTVVALNERSGLSFESRNLDRKKVVGPSPLEWGSQSRPVHMRRLRRYGP